MNDFAFGNRLYNLRKQVGLSQQALANLLGVTDKAVSKWENGKSKPTTDKLVELASFFGVPLEQLLSEAPVSRQITKIVITGGPCAGKTTAMSRIQTELSALGYTVLFIPETATELISSGVAPWTCNSNTDYQSCQMELQFQKERVFHKAANLMPAEKILVVCDRGMMDNRAYMSAAEFAKTVNKLGFNETELRDNYDAVFHLVTAAKGAEQFYTLDNNTARKESPELAAELDDKIIAAWTGHPHFRVIDNSTDFEAKIRRLLREITSFLGEPEPLEIERKYLIEYPDVQALSNLPNCRKIDIIQTYLVSQNGEERRVRQRGADGNYLYSETVKRSITGLKRIEIERRLTEREYLTRLMDADPTRHPIRKTRFCLTENNRYFEIDIFPFWKDRAILEIELSDENDAVDIPKMFKVIREVTDDVTYKNAYLANNNAWV